MNKFYGMIGIARKSGNLILGYDATVSFIASTKKECLVIIASDASEKTKKNILYECNKYKCEYVEYGNKVDFGKILNKKEVSVLAVSDINMISYLKNNT